VLARMPERLIVLRDNASGWTDFGSPGRVIDVLTQYGALPSWVTPGLGNGLGSLSERQVAPQPNTTTAKL
jgi:hypothetical protein